MHRKSVQSLLVVVLLAALASTGCAARQPTAAVGPPFRLGAVYGRPVLFPPSIPEANPNSSEISLEMSASSLHASAFKGCVAENGPFRAAIERTDPGSVRIALPSPERWIGDLHAVFDPEGDAVVSLYAMLGQLDQEREDSCFVDTAPAIRDFILQSLPMEPNDSLFNYYGYRSSRSGLELKPGMRLKVERAYLKSTATSGEGPSPEGPQGVSFVYFDVQSTSDGKVRFRRDGDVRFNPNSLRKAFHGVGLESELSARPPEIEYRLVFYGLHVPKQETLSASIIGMNNSHKLDEYERELRARPTQGCKNFAGTHSFACVDFIGWVTVTPQVSVVVNGKTKFVDCGTPVKDVLPEGALSSLTMQRKFMNSYRDVRFKRGDANLLLLVLVGGDRLTWAKSAPEDR